MAWLIERARSGVAHLSHGVDLAPLCGAENATGQAVREVGIESSRRPVCSRCRSIVATMYDTMECRDEYRGWSLGREG
jgi:hypothetical protein